ncbi:Zn-dependent hydrolase [Ancylobacter amanitiformis]|uniref:N-carbamoyl-L-amino-acid hydrolase n=1 Tax=Ancylobacter amanitiformis TaxID=217069 RepID=A0ABU0LWN1_9HYPH|nr:Zn-dependent hydrolase [Ancylobacter amanitiformis]MDQ0513089.1 N-carbamoyl-L-amino-acid hydrolase [Ancylobacter amanitiformis]
MSALDAAIAFAEGLFDELRANTTDAPGITRAAYGTGEEFAHALVRAAARELDLVEATDAAGNLYLTLAGTAPQLPGWIIGSHMDSVPHGGNYDGAAGVLAGLSVAHALRREGRRPERNLTVMVIRAEESTWFPVSYLGSRAAFGRLPREALEACRADTGLTLREHMQRLVFDPAAVARGEAFLDPAGLRGFIEVHIEQGPVLERADAPLGLVTGIAGSFRYREARCLGAYGHSGAVPRAYRQDAVLGFADLVAALETRWDGLEREGLTATITFGEVATDPTQHAFSKVPGEVGFCLDVRSASPEVLERIHAELLADAGVIAQRRGVRFEFGARTGSTPALLDPALRGQLAQAARRMGLRAIEMPSGAGHDTATFAAQGVPASLIFVRNQNGSHNPLEAMRMEDFAAAVHLLLAFLSTPGD